MAGKIFINYRRAQSLSEAQHLATVLGKTFGRRVFIDVRGIDGFSDWYETLKTSVSGTAAMISVIGKDWLARLDRENYPRGQSTKDFVRFEIAEALRRNIPVLMVLLDGAEAPSEADLPLEMQGMLRLQAMDLHAKRFPEDAAAIARQLKRLLAEAERARGLRRWQAAGLALAALAGGVAFGPYLFQEAGVKPPFVAPPLAPGEIRARLEEAERALRAVEAERDAARRALESAQDRAAAADAEAKRLGGLLQAAQAEGRAAGARADALARDAEAQKRAAAEAEREAKRLAGVVADRDREIAALKQQAAAAETARKAAEERADKAEAALARKPDDKPAGRDPARGVRPGSGQSFRDCPECPEMVVVPAGTFIMGSPDGKTPVLMLDGSARPSAPAEAERIDSEGPQHEVRIPAPFAVGKFEMTFSEWEACVAGGGCQTTKKPGNEGWGAGRRPVINVSWNDAREYVCWLNDRVAGRAARPASECARDPGGPYRLLSEAEWEYAARAGTTTPFSFAGGAAELCLYGNHADQSVNFSWKNTACSDGVGERTAVVGSYRANAWGLHDMHGNVWELVEDCWNGSYGDKPAGLKAYGAPWTTGNCALRVLRGGSWSNAPRSLRAAIRNGNTPEIRNDGVGFRVARTLNP